MSYLLINQVVGFYYQNAWKTPVEEGRLTGFYINGTLVDNELRNSKSFTTNAEILEGL